MSNENTNEHLPEAPATDDDITIEELDAVSGGSSISSISSVACPVSSVSTISPN